MKQATEMNAHVAMPIIQYNPSIDVLFKKNSKNVSLETIPACYDDNDDGDDGDASFFPLPL